MNFKDSEADAAFRSELRGWLAANLPEPLPPKVLGSTGETRYQAQRDWQRALAEGGWAGITWPREFGGRGATPVEQVIYLEEMGRARVPEPLGVIGLNMAGPTIIVHGRPDQKQRYLRKILTADEIWCQGFSEPEAGSDLAAVKTRAVKDGEEFVITGQKVWSSYAHIADFCILVARTDPDAEKHAGLSYFLVDMHLPGIEVRPIVQITGDPEFNEIFFDEVRVPASSTLDTEGNGWRVAMTTLMHERGTLGIALQVRIRNTLNDLIALARKVDRNGSPAIDDPAVRDALGWFETEAQAMRFTAYRSIGKIAATGMPGPEGSILKLHWSELNQRMTDFAWELMGPDSQIASKEDAVDGGKWQYEALRSRGNTIEAGTSEVLRNIVAERVLGLPRGR